MHMVIVGQGVNLSFMPKTPKGTGKNQTIVVLMKRRAAHFMVIFVGLTDALII
jgi:hypothetical protein